MSDSEDGKSIVSLIKDKRVQLGLGLLVLVVWNFWVLYDKGYVAEAVRSVLVFLVPFVVSFIAIIDYLASISEFMSIIIGLSFGGVAVSVVSKNPHDAEGKVRIGFIVPVFLLFVLFLLPVWSLYGNFCMWSGVASYIAIWIVGSLVFFMLDCIKKGRSLKNILLNDVIVGLVIALIMVSCIVILVVSLMTTIPTIIIYIIGLVEFGFILGLMFLNMYYNQYYTCDVCDCRSERFSTSRKASRGIIRAGWKSSSTYYSTHYCPSCVVKRQAKRERLKKRGVN